MLPYQALIAIVMFSPLLKCDDECPLIVHYSKEYGMSIYAGIYLEQGSIIESCVGVPVNSTAIAFSALGNKCHLFHRISEHFHDHVMLIR